MKDIRESFLYCVDIKKLRLQKLPNFIFLCGGETTTIKSEGQPNKYKSMRGAILDNIECIPTLSDKIRLAEDYKDWLEHGTIKNLIDFELAIADMAGAIVLILEAPGAYAELGSFSVLDKLSEKLILIVNNKLISENSYINLGPIKYLEDNSKVVLKYSWEVSYTVRGLERDKVDTMLTGDSHTLLEQAKMISNNINIKAAELSQKNPVLDLHRGGHLCFVIGDLIYNFSALRVHEIIDYLRDWFEIPNISLSVVKGYLYILKSFDFVQEVDVGDKYYVPTSKNKGFIKYFYERPLIDETDFKSLSEVKAHMLGYYAENDQARFMASAGI